MRRLPLPAVVALPDAARREAGNLCAALMPRSIAVVAVLNDNALGIGQRLPHRPLNRSSLGNLSWLAVP
jgi:hypothetical protein